MNILAIETATMVCGVALGRDGHVVSEKSVEERSVHAERLFGLIDDVLDKAHCVPRDLDAVAVSIGPGSFTGLRIGLSTAKGLHLALGIPVVAVPTLAALARRALPSFGGRRGHILAALDARRDEVYCQLFAVDSGRAVKTEEVQARVVRELVVGLPEGELLLTGDARNKILSQLRGNGVGARSPVVVAEPEIARCSAAEIARMGDELLKRKEYADPGNLEPHYVKEVFLGASH